MSGMTYTILIFGAMAVVLLAMRHFYFRRLRKVEDYTFQRLLDEIPVLPPVVNHDWPGVPEEYEMVMYRDAGFQVIDERRKVECLGSLRQAIQDSWEAGESGEIHWQKIVLASWSSSGLSQSP